MARRVSNVASVLLTGLAVAVVWAAPGGAGAVPSEPVRPATRAPGPDAWPGIADYESVPPALLAAASSRDAGAAVLLLEKVRSALSDSSPRAAALAAVAHGVALHRAGRFREAAATLAAVDRTRVAVADLAAFYEAEARFHAGEYAVAEKLLGSFADRWPESPWRHRAAFRLADCQLARDFHATGIATLRRLLGTYPEYPHQAAVHLAIAEAEVERGRVDAAASELRHLMKTWPGDPLAAGARRLLTALEARGARASEPNADARYAQAIDLRRRKYHESALSTFQALASEAGVDAGLKRRARRMAARTLLDLERFPEALAGYEALAADAPDAGQRREALKWKSRCLERLGRLDEAATAFEASRGTGTPGAADLHELAWLYLNNASYARAAETFARVAKSGGQWDVRTRWWRAWLSYRLGRYDEAVTALKKLHGTSKDRNDQYAYWLARSLARKGDVEAAVDTYRSLCARYPLSYYAFQARERLRELGRPAEAGDPALGAGAAGGRPGAPDAPEAADEPAVGEAGAGGACAGAGDDESAECERPAPATAEVAPGAVAEAPPTSPEGSAPVPAIADDAAPASPEVSSRAAATGGDTALAALASGFGGLFPALVEAHELRVLGEIALSGARLRGVSDELAAFRDRKARRHAGVWRYRPRPYHDNREGPARGEWGRELDDTPPPGDARRGATLAKGLPGELYRHLGQALVDVGEYHYARRHRLDRTPLRGPPEPETRDPRWAARYPRAFRALVEEQAGHYGLDPNFLWALMAQESIYNPVAVSHVGARGLMQVMPYTGTLIADRMAWRNFGPALLFEPRVVIEMSAWYFHQLLTKFNGQLPLAIAGYNAGPHRVAAWLERKGHLPMDEFIEEIPFTEARGYTKKVLHYLAIYRRVYEGESDLRVGQVIDPAFRDNINF